MNRRVFVTGVGALLVAPLAAEAQQSRNRPIIGYLGGSTPAATATVRAAFLQGLHDLGWIEGDNISIEYRWAGGNAEALGRAAAELVQLDVRVIVAAGTAVIRAAKNATSTIPIVMAGGGDPVGSGLVTSLAHPGGNITGVSLIGGELLGKCLSLLHEVAPRVKRIAVLFNAANPANSFFLKELETMGRSLGVQLDPLEVRSVDDVEAASARTQAGALLVLADPTFSLHAKLLADLATNKRWPTIFVGRIYVHAGGLMSYAFSFEEIFRRAAYYVDRILRGSKPGDLPVEQPTKFELVINLKTAKALGVTIPPSLLLRADQVIDQ